MNRIVLSAALIASAGAVFGYDVHTKALVPVVEDAKPAGAEMRFVENGRIGFTIVADMKTEGTVGARCGNSIRPAVDELTNAFVRCFGAAPAVCDCRDEAASAKAKYVLYVGDQPAVRALGIDCRKMPGQGFCVRTFEKGLVIAGNDSSLVPGYNAERYMGLGTSPGTLYGALDFCERFLGVRWYFPGPNGSVFPPQRDLVIAPVSYADEPYFNSRAEPWFILSGFFNEKKVAHWEPYFGCRMPLKDTSFCRYLRVGGTMPEAGMHSPNPKKLIRNFPDKTKLMFYTLPSGRHMCNASNVEQCYLNVFDLRFADFLVDELYKPYFASKGKVDLGGLRPYVTRDYISFGQCDCRIPASEWKNDPTVKALGLKSMADVYGRFQQYLARRIAKEFPGTRLFVLAYYNQELAPEDPQWRLPENFDVMLCSGALPKWVRRPDKLEGTMKRFRDWYAASGDHPISKVWLYNERINPFVRTILPEFVGEAPAAVGKYWGRDGAFFDWNGSGDMWHYFWCPYVSFRSQWNPKLDVDAAIEEMWPLLYGPEAGAHMSRFHRVLKNAYLDYRIAKDQEVYPVEIVDELERELAAAGACLGKETVEHVRWKMVADYWPKAFAQQRLRATYRPPRYEAPRTKGPMTVDGRADEPVWAAAPVTMLGDTVDPNRKTPWPTAVKMAWDAKGIYLLASGDWQPLVTPAKDQWTDNDAIELLLLQDLTQEVVYHFAWDLLGRQYSSKKRLKPVNSPTDSGWRPKGLVAKSTHGDGKWCFEAFVPFDVFEIQKVPRSGDEWTVNVTRDKCEAGRPAYEPVEIIGSSFTMGDNRNVSLFGTIRFCD